MRSPHEEHVRKPSFNEQLLKPNDLEGYDQVEDANELGEEDNDGECHDDDSVRDECRDR
jgi:hypothetical protein